jgi:Tfp pilus assembly protein PilF
MIEASSEVTDKFTSISSACLRWEQATFKHRGQQDTITNQQPEQLFKLAMNYLQSGNLPQAAGICEQILQVDPQHAHTFHLLGVIKGQQGNHDLAAEFFSKAVSADPSVPDFYRNLCHSCRSLGRMDEAIVNYRQAQRLTANERFREKPYLTLSQC